MDKASLHITLPLFEGELEDMLIKAREQELDLHKVSVAALALQYQEFLSGLSVSQLDAAAENLVMAAWVIFLKSRLLLPESEEETDSISADSAIDDEAQRMFRELRVLHLGVLRRNTESLFSRPLLGREILSRPALIDAQEDTREEPGHREISPDGASPNLHALFAVFGELMTRNFLLNVRVVETRLSSLEEALAHMQSMVDSHWRSLDFFVPTSPPIEEERMARSALSAAFVAALELTRQGRVELSQSKEKHKEDGSEDGDKDSPSAPLYLRALNARENARENARGGARHG